MLFSFFRKYFCSFRASLLLRPFLVHRAQSRLLLLPKFGEYPLKIGKSLNISQVFLNIMENIPNMENAFRILSLLEKDIFQEASLHQISKIINLDYKTIRKTVQQLLAEALLKKEIKGKAHFVSLNLNHSDIKTYLSFTAYYNRRTYFQKNASLGYLLEEIKKMELHDSCLVLFGSHVLNLQTKSSDVDLLLITKSKTVPAKMKSLLLNYNIKTDLNVLNFEQYQKALSNRGFNLVNQVLNKHIIFKNPELYWELTLRGLKNGNRY